VDASDARLVEAARGLGADVAFFLGRVPALLDGRGDVLRERFVPFSLPLVLVKPPVGVPTGRAYAELDALATPAPALDGLVGLLRAGDAPRVPLNTANNMEPAARRIAPELDEVFSFLEAQPALAGPPLLCGSGSCVAAFVHSDADADHVAARARARSWWACPTRTLA
jgi:4-diphosphocytidyl-2-C-methyl-D-erythritol kinase